LLTAKRFNSKECIPLPRPGLAKMSRADFADWVAWKKLREKSWHWMAFGLSYPFAVANNYCGD
jgi:hypothetical protein